MTQRKTRHRKGSAAIAQQEVNRIRHVASRRLGDAKCLLAKGTHRHNGAMYLAGYVIECHLKGDLLEAHPHLATADSKGLSKADTRLKDLIYRHHDLLNLIANLPGTIARLTRSESSNSLVQSLRSVASAWSVRIRYDSKDRSTDEVVDFIARVEELHTWLSRNR